jgi:hypothetical protein
LIIKARSGENPATDAIKLAAVPPKKVRPARVDIEEATETAKYKEVLSVSVENLKKYGKLCEENEEVLKKFKEIGVQDIEGQITYAKSLGLELSKEDFEVLAKETELNRKGKLSEEELQNASGGGSLGDIYDDILNHISDLEYSQADMLAMRFDLSKYETERIANITDSIVNMADHIR